MKLEKQNPGGMWAMQQQRRRGSCAGSRILHLTMKVAARVVLHVVGGVHDPAPGVVEPVGAGGVETAEVAVEPRHSEDGGDAEAADR